MGSPVAPAYANIVMAWWELEVLPLLKQKFKVEFFCRFIDDLVFILEGGPDIVDQFMVEVNSLSRFLKFTKGDVGSAIIHLWWDSIGCQFQSKIHRKETFTNGYLHFSSGHPKYMIKNIPKGQFIRACRLTTRDCDLSSEFNFIIELFSKRGYDITLLDRKANEVLDRCLMDFPAILGGPSSGTIGSTFDKSVGLSSSNLICSFEMSDDSFYFSSILENNWKVIKGNSEIHKVLGDKPKFVFSVLYYRFAVAMMFAVSEINRNPYLLPNHTLGYIMYDSCYAEVRALEVTMRLLSGEKLVPNYHCGGESWPLAIIGDSPSASSLIMARLLGIYRFPQISYGSVLALLGDKQQFPSFLRTISNFTVQVEGIIRLMKHFSWTWIGILASDNDIGIEASQGLLQELAKRDNCVAFLEILPAYNSKSRLRQIVEKIKAPSVKVIIVYSTQLYLIPLMEEVTMHNVSDKVWIAPTHWANSLVFYNKENWKTLNGTLVFAKYNPEIPGFQEFVQNITPSPANNDNFLNLFWETVFHCKLLSNNNTAISPGKATSFCTGVESLKKLQTSVFESYSFQESISAYNAAYAIAHGLHNLLSCDSKDGIPENVSCAAVTNLHPCHQAYTRGMYIIFLTFFFYFEVPRAVCSESCVAGYRKSMRKGQPICCFDCVPCSEGEISNHSNSNDCTRCVDDQWPTYAHEKCIPKTIEFLSYKEPLGASLAATSISCAIITASVLCIFIKFKETPIVKANNRDLSYLLLFALILCFLCSLIFIGYPKTETCLLRQAAFGVIFSFCVSCILAKTITVIIAFTSTKPNSPMRKLMGTKTPVSVIIFCSLIQVIICVAWLSTDPPFPNANMVIKPGTIIMECQEGSSTAFGCMLGYMFFLSLTSFAIAFLARKLPATFNEAQLITFSMIVFVSLWASFIPAYLSTQGKYMVAVEVFAILASGSGLLCSIFVPKCYIILLKPEKNTRKHLTGKTDHNTMK
ncbi:extracellular calcium-sensing receptor-like [Protopterus annectens]|uniref:extracellular calcium-sensing receptor-like n=1 Tax=Protopterus annectens TaxID=7888 RepID=UPI001CFA29B2|nr:extracellular calcium-sensing receptor-like [Protopterus annectens]